MQKHSRCRLQELILQGRLDEAEAYCLQLAEDNHTEDKELAICYLLFVIRAQERRNKEACIFEFSRDLETLDRHYHILKLLIRRLEFDWLQADPMELVTYCVENRVSLSALTMIVRFSTRDPRQVLEKVKRLFQEYQENGEPAGNGGAAYE